MCSMKAAQRCTALEFLFYDSMQEKGIRIPSIPFILILIIQALTELNRSGKTLTGKGFLCPILAKPIPWTCISNINQENDWEICARFVTTPIQNRSKHIKRDQNTLKTEFVGIFTVTAKFVDYQGVAKILPYESGVRIPAPLFIAIQNHTWPMIDYTYQLLCSRPATASERRFSATYLNGL